MASDEVPEANPVYVQLVAGILRHVLSGLGAAGIGFGATISDSNLMIVAGSICWIIVAGWSIWQKFQADRKLVAVAAKMS